ncbi:MAG TPA: DNA repair protein RadA [Patescibacteria group bacterium]|nr:DNA repair protein RadA [Patescibacteria group bacterium]
MKTKASFVCQECGYESPGFLGKCPECGQWNTLKEVHLPQVTSGKLQGSNGNRKNSTPQLISTIKYTKTGRISTNFSEADSVLGGGIVPGSVTLLAGDPGIGKSTLLLQVAYEIAKEKGNSVLYISGEESEEQIKLRAQRILKNTKNVNLFLLSLNNPDEIIEILEKTKPTLAIVDSIQTMESESLPGLSGSVGQVRYGALQLSKAAKLLGVPIILVGHVTKEGTIAGPMILSHMVDSVLFLEGEKTTGTRILRSFKNRYGPVDEVGIFSMEGEGMIEVKNPEMLFLSQKPNSAPGSVMVATLEGTRAFLVEIQALVVYTKNQFPKRVSLGIDYKRLELLLAVLQKHCKLPLDGCDVFVNVAGGLRISDPATDLGICLAIFSSYKNVSLPKTVGIAEVGLLGELRNVSSLEKRLKVAKSLGFKNIISPESFDYLSSVLRNFEK